MPAPDIVTLPELEQLIADREKAWSDFDRSQTLAAELGRLSASVPPCAPAKLQLQFGEGSTPAAELEAVLPTLKEKIKATRKLHAEVRACRAEIEAIRRREKTFIAVAVAAGVVVLLLLVGVLTHFVFAP